jgi:hypothetical protein
MEEMRLNIGRMGTLCLSTFWHGFLGAGIENFGQRKQVAKYTKQQAYVCMLRVL